jgi:hypothetical protein
MPPARRQQEHGNDESQQQQRESAERGITHACRNASPVVVTHDHISFERCGGMRKANVTTVRSTGQDAALCVQQRVRQRLVSFGMTDDLPDDAVAYREYEISLPDGGRASVAFTLGAPDLDTVPATMARVHGALAYGLISIADYPGAPEYPMVWLQTKTELGITVADDDEDLADPLKRMIARYLAVFFADIAPIAPELAALKLKSDIKGDRTLN